MGSLNRFHLVAKFGIRRMVGHFLTDSSGVLNLLEAIRRMGWQGPLLELEVGLIPLKHMPECRGIMLENQRMTEGPQFSLNDGLRTGSFRLCLWLLCSQPMCLLAGWPAIECSLCKTLGRDPNMAQHFPSRSLQSHEEEYYNTRQEVISAMREMQSKWCSVWKRLSFIEKEDLNDG